MPARLGERVAERLSEAMAEVNDNPRTYSYTISHREMCGLLNAFLFEQDERQRAAMRAQRPIARAPFWGRPAGAFIIAGAIVALGAGIALFYYWLSGPVGQRELKAWSSQHLVEILLFLAFVLFMPFTSFLPGQVSAGRPFFAWLSAFDRRGTFNSGSSRDWSGEITLVVSSSGLARTRGELTVNIPWSDVGHIALYKGHVLIGEMNTCGTCVVPPAAFGSDEAATALHALCQKHLDAHGGGVPGLIARRLRRVHDRCDCCRYDLYQHIGTVCPECGASLMYGYLNRRE